MRTIKNINKYTRRKMIQKAVIIPMFGNKKKTEVMFLLFQRVGQKDIWSGLTDAVECESDSYENAIDFLLEATKGTIGEKKTLMNTKPFYTVKVQDSKIFSKENIYYIVKMDLCEKYVNYLNNSLRRDRPTHTDDLKEVKAFTIGEMISLSPENGDQFLKSLLLEDLHKFRNGLH